MRAATFATAVALMLGAPLNATAAEQSREEQVCQTRASENNITDEMRPTFMRECLAGERLNKEAPPK